MDRQIGLYSRILRDVTDGVMVLDAQGAVMFINPSGKALLGIGDDAVGRKYAEVMREGMTRENDGFHQFLLDAVYDKENAHKGQVDYTRPDGAKQRISISTEFLRGEDGASREGVVIQFSDITELTRLQQRQKDASVVFVTVISCVCGWMFICVIWELLGRPISTHWMTQIVQLCGVIMFAFILKNTSFTVKDMGLGIKNIGKIIRLDTLIALGGLAALILAKLVVRKLVPGFFDANEPFWNWKMGFSQWIYPLTVVLQEFLTRGVMHENLRRIFTGKHSETIAIIVSSLIFGVLHIYLGIVYMAGATLLLGALGMLYRKQNTIWGLCIPHYICGIALTFLGWG